MSLERVADALYAGVPEDFVPARDQAAKAARAAGDRDLAAALAALRRPAVSAWLVNAWVRTDPEAARDLVDLGRRLASAQQDGDAVALRTLSAERRTVVAGVGDRIAAVAGRAVSGAVQAEVRATLEAALADPGSAAAVLSGRLVRPLSYAGFGPVDLEGAVAGRQPDRAPSSARPRQPAPADARATSRQRDVTAAQAVALEAAGRLDDAVLRLDDAARRLEDAVRLRAEAVAEASAAEQALADARHEVTAAERTLASARSALDTLLRS